MERPDAAASPQDEPGPGLPAVAEALSACVREALERGEQAEVPGLGTFRVAHRPSEMEEAEDGQVSLSAPRDEIVFEPAGE